ncbi:phospho-N-acetylmuramoyl-pentapeptide-transferase [Actinobacillus pleuropneumoniae]|nr:phospho-N-acetylmuramoyl-pentapeptide-transferase [Actinobacillus pleuropneumoniae]
MLVWLAEYLVQYNTAFNVVSYITFPCDYGVAYRNGNRFMDWVPK